MQIITTALNAAQATSEHASAASSAAAAELAAQTAMVGAAKARLHAIEEQLHHARIDFEAAQHANLKAAHAALVKKIYLCIFVVVRRIILRITKFLR